jgi:hypothetical protein
MFSLHTLWHQEIFLRAQSRLKLSNIKAANGGENHKKLDGGNKGDALGGSP